MTLPTTLVSVVVLSSCATPGAFRNVVKRTPRVKMRPGTIARGKGRVSTYEITLFQSSPDWPWTLKPRTSAVLDAFAGVVPHVNVVMGDTLPSTPAGPVSGARIVAGADEPDAGGAPVRDVAEEVETGVHIAGAAGADMADEDGLGAAVALEDAEPLVEAEHADDVEGVAQGAEGVDWRLAGKGGTDDGAAGGAGGCQPCCSARWNKVPSVTP